MEDATQLIINEYHTYHEEEERHIYYYSEVIGKK